MRNRYILGTLTPQPDNLSRDLASLRIAREENPETKGRARNWLIGISLVGVGLGGASVAVQSLAARFSKSEVAITQIRLISPAQSSIQVSATGYVVPQLKSRVGAQVIGRVAEVKVKEGERVKSGQILVLLVESEARSALAAAKARSQAAQARLATTRQQYEREKRLADQGASTRAVAEDLKTQLAANQADADAADAEVSSAQVALDRTVIRAPINGVVVGKPIPLGELVGPGSGPVAELDDFDSMVVEADVPEARLHVVKEKSPAEIVLDAYPERRFRGETLEISPRVDRAKATVVVKVRFVDPVDVALPDMAARVSFLAKALDEESIKQPAKLFVPASAIAERDGRKVVFVVADERVRMEPVTLGPPLTDGYELANGPPDGTAVVANAPPTLADGQKIKERTP